MVGQVNDSTFDPSAPTYGNLPCDRGVRPRPLDLLSVRYWLPPPPLLPWFPPTQLHNFASAGGREGERERERVAACPLNDAWGGDRLMQTQMASEHVFSHSLGLSVEASFLYYVCFLFSLSPPYGELFQTVLLS